MSQLQTASPFEIRADFEELVLNDLRGPANGPEEEVNERKVSSRYLVGWLAPKDLGRGPKLPEAETTPEPFPDDSPLNPIAEDTSLGAGGEESSEEGMEDDLPTGTESMLPNSLGMTFCLAPGIDRIRVRASWGWYQRRKSELGYLTPKGDPAMVWFRTPVGEDTEIDLTVTEPEPWSPFPDVPSVYVRRQVRKETDGSRLVTLFLVNDQDGKDGKDSAWLFQVKLEAETVDGSAGFIRRRVAFPENANDHAEKIENLQTRMNYRNNVEFAVGHGTSVDWLSIGDPVRAVAVWTTPVPHFEVPKANPNEDIKGLNLSMKFLAESPMSELRSALIPMVEAYDEWIDLEAQKAKEPQTHLSDFTECLGETERQARIAAKRVRAGIDLVSTNPTAYDAFVFMNRAMYEQRRHSLLSQQVRRGQTVTLEEVDAKGPITWYPFQLAFVLVNLPSLADPEHPERCEGADPGPTAELLWFPTGGGKTESYLGLTAFTLAIRRLQGEIAGKAGEQGVAVLMRYTLRLLTLQQFQRATALICACEVIRRSAPSKWGETKFRIGLWVGQASTPNNYDQAASALSDARGADGRRGSKGTLQQLTNCPWCGSAIEIGKHILPDPETRRLITYCGDPLGRCPFSCKQAEWEGLPICIVDEEIYRLLPSLVIATVDKFAQMPWNGETAMLFGKVAKKCPRHGFLCPASKHEGESHIKTPKRFPRTHMSDACELRPPDLIIQDELHLITGPLGSLVGLYETAIDELCTWTVNGKRVTPKVVVSTATIRRAGDQVYSLFARRLEIFPPRGVDASDNFFSKQVPSDEHNPGLRYLGICATGRRLKVALIRVYVACLCAGQFVYEKHGKAADPYMTTVGYFSSIRELGGMRRLLDDDVKSRMRQMDKRGLSRRNFVGGYDELTSRKSAGDIPALLDRLEADFDPEKEALRQAERAKGEKRTTKAPLDVVIATNMISVGVDVPRLGLMIVAGQPKQTAEYVQATARVGRRFPGLVITVHNWARPRDLSHFETFRHFHATFHTHIEAPSVTPFAAGARERAVAGVLTSLVRLHGPRFNSDASAGDVKDRSETVKHAVSVLRERAALVTSGSVAEAVKLQANGLVDYWINEALKPHRTLAYKDNTGFAVSLLKQPDEESWKPFTCLNSLREVEQSSNLRLMDISKLVSTIAGASSVEDSEESV